MAKSDLLKRMQEDAAKSAQTGNALPTKSSAAKMPKELGTVVKKGSSNTLLPESASAVKKEFYSRPEVGAQTAQLKDVLRSGDALGTKVEALKSAEAALKQAQADAEEWDWHVQLHRDRYQKDPSKENAERFFTACEGQDALRQKYTDAASAYEYAYADYASGWTHYDTLRQQYTDYQNAERKKYEDWRGTIRDAQTIQADLDAVGPRIEAQKLTDAAAADKAYQDKSFWEVVAESLAGVQDTTLPMAAAGGTASQGQYKPSQELQALLDKQKLLQEEYDWSQYFKYADLMDAEDFEKNSRYVSTANGKKRNAMQIMADNYSAGNSGWDDPLYEYVNGNKEAGAYLSNMAAAYYGSDNEIGAFYGRTAGGETESQQMTEDEVKIFNYLYATQGKEAAHAYYEYLRSDLNYRQRQAAETQWKEYAAKDPVGSSLFSFAISPAKGLSYLGQISDYITEGKIDQNASYNQHSYIGSAIREKVAEQIENSGKWGKVGSFAYQTGMSMGDFLLNTAITGGNSTFSLAIMGTGAAADATIAAKDRRLNDNQAFLLGTIAGAAEILTEKVSLDTLLDGRLLADGTWKYIVKNMAAEGSEEVGSDLINLLADILISKDQSEWAKSIDSYVADGKSRGEAFGLALADQAITLGLDFVGGALSGGIMAGGNAAINYSNSQQVRDVAKKAQLDQAGIQDLIDSGLESDPDSDSYKLAVQLQEKLNQGKTITTDEQARLMQANEIAMQEERAALQTPQTAAQELTMDIQGQIERHWGGIVTGTVGTEQQRQQMQRLSKATGREVVLYEGKAFENGYYENGKIYVNINGADPAAQVFSHELTHSIETADVYKELSSLVFERMQRQGADIAQMRREKAAMYASNGTNLAAEDVDREIVAEYVSRNLLSDEQSIVTLTQESPSLGRKILNWLNKVLAKLGNSNAQERAFLEQARSLYAQALNQTQSSLTPEMMNPSTGTTVGSSVSSVNTGVDTEAIRQWLNENLASGEMSEAEYDSIMDLIEQEEERQAETEKPESKRGKRQHSYAGPGARTAQSQKLDKAVQMRDQGIDNEEIRQKTGWYFGMDGLPRFEIDDSQMQISENVSNYMRLGDLLQHDALYEAYPDLADIDVTFATLEPGTYGTYNRQFDSITISRELMGLSEEIKDALSHEIQHAIQNREGFTHGASPQGWERKIRNGFDSRRPKDRRLAQETEQRLAQIHEQQPEFYREMMELEAMTPNVPRGETNWDTLEQIEEDPVEWQQFDARRDAIAEEYGEMEVFDFFNLLDDRQRLAKAGRTGVEMYYDTAGEIEARDSERRRRMSADQRKTTPPKLGNADTVFSDSTGIDFDTTFSQYPYDMQTVIKDYLDAVDDNVLSFVKEVAAGKAWRGKKITVGTADSRLISDLKRITGVENEPGVKILMNTSAIEHIKSRHGENGEHGHSMSNDQDIARINYVIQNYDEAELGRKVSGEYKNRDGSRAQIVVLSKKINGTYFVVEAVPDTGKIAVVSAYISKTGASQVPDDNAPSRDVQNELASTPITSVPQEGQSVKRQFSYSAQVTSKRDVINDLKGILARGGSTAELRSYVANMERSSQNAERMTPKTNQMGAEAEQILKAAQRRGITVDEYLRWNWEQYEYDGELNEAARQAQELEKRSSRRQYSISDDQEGANEPEAPVSENAQEDIRSTMSSKAKASLAGAERKMIGKIGYTLGVSKFADRSALRDAVQEISDEYIREGTVSEEVRDRLFETAYEQGVIVDREFYDQYKDIKDTLRTTAITLSKAYRSDIADYDDLRRKSFGTLRIVNEGGTPVDVFYEELRSEAPGLFPADIMNPADQLIRMYEASRSIRIAEATIDGHYGSAAEQYKRTKKIDFNAAINDYISQELRKVKRFVDDQAAQRETQEDPPVTEAEAAEMWAQLKTARRTYEKAQAKNLLTRSDEIQVGRLLKGEILPEHLNPDRDNVDGITAVYESKKEYERLCKLLGTYKKNQKAKLRDLADGYLETANKWKDKKVGIAYSRETMTRNVLDIVPDQKIAKAVNREFFEPVAVAEAASTRFKNAYRDRVRKLELSTKADKGNLVSEAHAVQLLGEAQDNIQMLEKARGRIKHRDGKSLDEWYGVVNKLWAENPGLDKAKIERAVQEFRKIYDELFQKMNEVRVRNGYEPVNYRKGYFPHFQPGPGDGVFAQFGRLLGIDTQVDALPTTINGLTHTFKPGIQWMGNALERLGFDTAYDAVEGFDKYIEGAASVIHQTENIQKLRALASQIRYRTSDEGIKKQVDAVNADPRLTEEEKKVQIDSIYEHGRFTLSNFVVELDEYTNLLANKKSKLDRTMEGLLGRKAYTVMKAWENRVGANMIAGNLSSALTNIIPLTQAGAQLDRGSILRGMWSALQSYRKDDGIVGMSAFLTNRRGSDPLIKNWVQKASEVMGLPMELIDNFVSDSIVRAAYFQNLRRGLSEGEAMHQADLFAAGVMADRSKGAMPTLFESRNPIFKAFTQFQLEVNNQFSEVFKDLPRGFKEKGLAALALVLLKYFLGAFLFNEVYEYFIGRRPALDPIGILNDTVGDLTGYELPNLLDLGIGMIAGDAPSFETERVGLGEAGANLATAALEELPFSSGLGLLGVELDGGRIPVSSAIPSIPDLWDAATNTEWSGAKRWDVAQDELNKLAYIIPPFGGNQISKLWKGVKAYIEGGSYNVDAQGNDILQYPVYRDDPKDAFWNLVRSALMGKSSLPEAQAWVESGFDSLGAQQTAVYQDLLEAGVRDRDAYALLTELQAAEETEEGSRAEAQREILRASDVSGEGKAIVYYGLMATDSDRALLDSLADVGADAGAVTDVLIEIRDANALTGADASCAKRDAIVSAPLTDNEKIAIYRDKVSSSRDADIEAFRDAGLDFDKFLKAHNEYTRINEKYDTASERATEFARWVNRQGFTDRQEAIVKDSFAYYSQIPASAASYDDFLEAGLEDEAAYDLAKKLEKLEPEAGKNSVSSLQKYQAIIGAGLDEESQMEAFSQIMTDSEYTKLRTGNAMGVTPTSYVELKAKLPQYDADGNGNMTQAEVKAAVDTMGLTVWQKAALWQIQNKSWSARNNPYDTTIGQQVYDLLNSEEPEEGSTSFGDEVMRQLMGG